MDRNIKDLWEGFAEAVLFTSYDENDEPLDYTIYDFDEESESRTKKLLENYYSKYKEQIEESELPLNTIGNDIWYARSGQGVGFFDHSLDSDIEEKLTKGATDMGEYASAFEQDGKVYIEDGRKMSFGGGVAVGGIVGAYLGYKAGRMRPQKAGFETEKKIGRRIKKEGQKIAGDMTISKKKPQTMAKGGNIKPKYKLGDSVIVDYGNNTKGEITIKDSFNPNWSNGFVYTSYENGDSMVFTEDMISERDGFNEVWGRFKDGIRKDFGGDKFAEGGGVNWDRMDSQILEYAKEFALKNKQVTEDIKKIVKDNGGATDRNDIVPRIVRMLMIFEDELIHRSNFAEGGKTHTMPDGSTMLNSDHYAKGGSMASGGEIKRAEIMLIDDDSGEYAIYDLDTKEFVEKGYSLSLEAEMDAKEMGYNEIDGVRVDSSTYAEGGEIMSVEQALQKYNDTSEQFGTNHPTTKYWGGYYDGIISLKNRDSMSIEQALQKYNDTSEKLGTNHLTTKFWGGYYDALLENSESFAKGGNISYDLSDVI